MKCPNCEKEFNPKRKTSKYCSVYCARWSCHKIFIPKKVSKELIIKLYCEEKLSMANVAKRIGCGETMIHKWLHRFNVPIRTRSQSLLGRKKSEEHIEKHRLALRGKYVLEKSFNWKGGKSFEPYGKDWKETLKESIRQRDNNMCQLCGKTQNNRRLSVHHIDYCKKNLNPDNLIALCLYCHAETNDNRDYWIKFWNNLIKNGVNSGESPSGQSRAKPEREGVTVRSEIISTNAPHLCQDEEMT